MSDTMPISMLKTQAAKNEVANYRALGVTDSNMRFIRNDGGEEIIVVNKDAVTCLAKRSPLDASRRISNLLDLGVSLTLDDELELFQDEKGRP